MNKRLALDAMYAKLRELQITERLFGVRGRTRCVLRTCGCRDIDGSCREITGAERRDTNAIFKLNVSPLRLCRQAKGYRTLAWAMRRPQD